MFLFYLMGDVSYYNKDMLSHVWVTKSMERSFLEDTIDGVATNGGFGLVLRLMTWYTNQRYALFFNIQESVHG